MDYMLYGSIYKDLVSVMELNLSSPIYRPKRTKLKYYQKKK